MTLKDNLLNIVIVILIVGLTFLFSLLDDKYNKLNEKYELLKTSYDYHLLVTMTEKQTVDYVNLFAGDARYKCK